MKSKERQLFENRIAKLIKELKAGRSIVGEVIENAVCLHCNHTGSGIVTANGTHQAICIRSYFTECTVCGHRNKLASVMGKCTCKKQ